MKNIGKFIYVLVAPSLPNFVRIGFANNLQECVNQINDLKITQQNFEIFGYFECEKNISNAAIANVVKKIYPNVTTKKIKRLNFFLMSINEAEGFLKALAEINNSFDHLYINQKYGMVK